MKFLFILLSLTAVAVAGNRPEDVLLGTVHRDIQSAISAAKEKHKPVFAIVYDNRSKTKSRIDVIPSFVSTKAERRLLDESFIQALVSLSSPAVQKYFPLQKDPLELCEILVIDENGKLVTHRPIGASLGGKIIEQLLDEVAKAK